MTIAAKATIAASLGLITGAAAYAWIAHGDTVFLAYLAGMAMRCF